MTSRHHETSNVSVIVTAHDNPALLENTLDSLRHQTRKPLEVLVVDTGLPENAGKIIYSTIHGARLIQPDNICGAEINIAYYRNQAIDTCEGDYIAFIDAGDYWLPHYLEEIEHLATHYPHADCLATHYQILEGDNHYADYTFNSTQNEQNHFILHNYFKYCHEGKRPLASSACVFRKTSFATFGYYLDGDTLGEADDSLFSRVAVLGRIACSARVLSIINQHDFNLKTRVMEKPLPYINWLYSMTFHPGHAKQEKSEILAFVSDKILELAHRNILTGHLATADKLLQDQRAQYCTMRRMGYRCLYQIANTLQLLHRVYR